MKKILIILSVVLTVVVVTEVMILNYIVGPMFLKKPPVVVEIPVVKSSPYDYWLKKKPIMTSSIKTDISEGRITAVDIKGGTMKVNDANYGYALKINLKNSNGSTYDFIYDTNDLKKISISTGSGKLGISSLSVGDTLEIKETTNLLPNSNTIISVDIKKK